MTYEEASTDAALASDARWQLVQRVVSSPTFTSSQPLQDFLMYVSELTLLGRSDEIKEQMIGSNVLRRSSDFDPATDNIVRVRARQLRLKLEQFFASEGIAEPILIHIPRGGYVPVFEPRAEISEPLSESPTTMFERKGVSSWLPWCLSAVLAVVCILLWVSLEQLNSRDRKILPTPSRRLWSQIFTKNETTLVVLSDPSFGMWQGLSKKDLSIQEYLRLQHSYGDAPTDGALTALLTSNQISISAAHFLTSVVPISEVLGAGLNVRPAWRTNVTDFKAGNAILMGSRRSNPWTELFEPHLHHIVVHPQSGQSYFKTRPNDAVQAEALNDADARSYALVALLPNVTHTGKVLLIEGLTVAGTDAAIEFLTRPLSCALLMDRVATQFGSTQPPFEALLQLTPVSAESANVSLIGVWSPVP
jgi:hypothetical protein